MKERIDKINNLMGRITKLCKKYESEEGELIRNIVKGTLLEEKLVGVEKVLEEIEAELKDVEG